MAELSGGLAAPVGLLPGPMVAPGSAGVLPRSVSFIGSFMTVPRSRYYRSRGRCIRSLSEVRNVDVNAALLNVARITAGGWDQPIIRQHQCSAYSISSGVVRYDTISMTDKNRVLNLGLDHIVGRAERAPRCTLRRKASSSCWSSD